MIETTAHEMREPLSVSASPMEGKIHYFPNENGDVASTPYWVIAEVAGEWFLKLSHDDLYYRSKK